MSPSPGAPADQLAVLDWRRQVGSLYADVRAGADPAAAHAAWASGRSRLMTTHPASPLLAQHRGAAGVEVAPYDPRLRFDAEVLPVQPEHLEVPTGTDGVVVLDRIGTVRLGGLGTLDVWWLGSYGGGVFVPLRDGTSGRRGADGHAGYGGGRYLLDTVKGADLGSTSPARLTLDLNFAYHPSCAYDPAWACPLPPPGNRIEAAVSAGERYVGPWAHDADGPD